MIVAFEARKRRVDELRSSEGKSTGQEMKMIKRRRGSKGRSRVRSCDDDRDERGDTGRFLVGMVDPIWKRTRRKFVRTAPLLRERSEPTVSTVEH